MDVAGGMELLQAAGFQLVFEDDPGGGPTEGCPTILPLRLFWKPFFRSVAVLVVASQQGRGSLRCLHSASRKCMVR